MSEIKALEKLRKDECHLCVFGLHIGEIADEIQAEVDSRFIELPVDADGVPIHPGDKMELEKGGTVIVDYVNKDKFKTEGWCWRYGKDCRHVKSRTLEDILEELVECATFPGEPLDRGDIEGFADEIRELLGSDK